MMPSRLPYPWKIVVAAAVIAVLIVAVLETRKRWSAPRPKLAAPAPSADTRSGLYTDTLARVQEIIAAHTTLQPEVVTASMPLVDLGIDPLTRMEVADALESAYKINITPQELVKVEIVDDLVQLVVTKQQERPISAKFP